MIRDYNDYKSIEMHSIHQLDAFFLVANVGFFVAHLSDVFSSRHGSSRRQQPLRYLRAARNLCNVCTHAAQKSEKARDMLGDCQEIVELVTRWN